MEKEGEKGLGERGKEKKRGQLREGEGKVGQKIRWREEIRERLKTVGNSILVPYSNGK